MHVKVLSQYMLLFRIYVIIYVILISISLKTLNIELFILSK